MTPYDLRATGPLAGTGAGRTARKADTGAGFHPATRPTSFSVALADLEYVLAWLRQSEAPENIIGLQERAADLIVGREVACGCKRTCGDDGDTEGPGTCKGLPRPPREPLVEIVLVRR